MEQTQVNYYALLVSQAKAALRNEVKLSPEQRSKISWMFHVEFCGTTAVLGKGGANTLWLSLGGGKKHLGFPDVVLGHLNSLARQGAAFYRVHLDGSLQTKFAKKRAMKTKPLSKVDFIEAVSFDHKVRVVVRAKRNLAGKLTWIAL